MIEEMGNAKCEMRSGAASRPRPRLWRVDSFRIPHSAFRIAPRPRGVPSSFILHPSSFSSAFTLFEVILALMLLGLLTGAVYSITSAAGEASRATMSEQAAVRRVEAFIKVTRGAFLNLPRNGRIQLRFSKSPSGAPVPEVIFEEAPGVFGVPSLGGGSLILAARPRADGSRTMALLLVPRDLSSEELERLKSGNSWIPLLPRVERVKWSFFANGEWKDEWPPEAGRPLTARLEMESLDMGGSIIDAQFWIPPLAAGSAASAPNPQPTLPPRAP